MKRLGDIRWTSTAAAVWALAALAPLSPARGQQFQEYQWVGTGGAGLSVMTNPPLGPLGSAVSPPTSVEISLTYEYLPGGPSQTLGDTTFYSPSDFWFSIVGTGSSGWPGFTLTETIGMSVTVPTNGEGMDEISFTGFGDFSPYGSTPVGSIELEAPLGTLSTSTVQPPNLDAFEQYGQSNFGGTWGFTAPFGWEGQAGGWIGPYSVPEPGSFWLLAIGAAGGWGLRLIALPRRRRAARDGRPV